MNRITAAPPVQPSPSDSAATISCEFCGAPGASLVGGAALCLSCYVELGSCCHEDGCDEPAPPPSDH